MFNKILIANRGEIAVRVMATAKKMGVKTVAVYSDADAQAQHVKAADEAVYIGSSVASESYLVIDKIIAAAKQTGAEAIHPGYGFLSENAEFARRLEQEGIEFIGPSAEAIEAMGDKASAKALLQDADVPLVPGYHGEDQDDALLKQSCLDMGFPVLIKASAGGGGKGMRVVMTEAEFEDELAAARREAMHAFGDDRMLIEKYLLKPRHVEVQVFCDKHGNGVYLYERDCSVQRRHQKVIEEAPAPGVDGELRKRMGEAALNAAKAINYRGAGTVEFLLDVDGKFYFMEMNTRLQVEHPVTEKITQQDLVSWQLKVASGETLPLTQEQVPCVGHSIEVRLYAEDPDNNFLPAIGDLSVWQGPQSFHTDSKVEGNIRLDSGVIEGDTVSQHYDPMMAKLIVWDENRDAAIKRMQKALTDMKIYGVKNNRDFLAQLIGLESFKNVELSTDFIERNEQALADAANTDVDASVYAAICLVVARQQKITRASDVWSTNNHYRMNVANTEQMTVHFNDELLTIDAAHQSVNKFTIGDTQIDVLAISENSVTATINGVSEQINYRLLNSGLDEELVVFLPTKTLVFETNRWLGEKSDGLHEGGVAAPMAGSILQVNVKAGDQVKAGDVLVIMEAMKMEHSIRAAHDAEVIEVFYAVGDQVAEGKELLELSDNDSE